MRAEEQGPLLLVNGTLEALTPLHVGGVDSTSGTDLMIARDGAGRPFVPATTIAGFLRGISRLLGADETLICDVWGDDQHDGHASRVTVDHGLINQVGRQPEVWDHVGIDRQWGSAAAAVKFDREVVPMGSTLDLSLEVELPADTGRADLCRELVWKIVTLLEQGDQRLGGAVTGGFGRVKLAEVAVSERNLASRDGMLALLAGTPADDLERPKEIEVDSPLMPVKISWAPDGPLMVRASAPGHAEQALPRTTRTRRAQPGEPAARDQVRLVIPGSSIKGALRTHAERIARTVTGCRAPTIGDGDGDRPLDLSDQVTGLAPVDRLFGAPRPADVPSRDLGGATRKEESGGRGWGALWVDPCLTTWGTSPAQWSDLIRAEREQSGQPDQGHQSTNGLDEVRNKLGLPAASGLPLAHHTAVDRWLGSAAPGRLFTVLEPHGFEWEPLSFTINRHRLGDDETGRAAAFLFLLLLADLHDGRIPLGAGGNRGLGGVTVKSVTLGAADITSSADQGFRRSLDSLPPGVLGPVTELQKAWAEWARSARAPRVEVSVTTGAAEESP